MSRVIKTVLSPGNPSSLPTPTEHYHSECYERRRAEKPPTPKPKCPAWPPKKPIEDITFPTASPIYFDPYQERRTPRRNSESYDNYSDMDNVSCTGPVYRRVEVCGSQRRESRQSRCSSVESTRRSLTPTKITQPVPRPWTATVTTNSSVYQQPEKHYQKYREQQMHEEISECDGSKHREEKRCYHAKYTEESDPEPEPEPEPEPCTCTCYEEEPETEDSRPDLSTLVPPDVAICPKGVDGEHDLYTETEEKDVGEFHIKKTTTYEKTVEYVDPDEEKMTRKSEDKEVARISDRKNVATCVDMVSSKIDTMQMMEQAQREDEDEKRQQQLREVKRLEEIERKRREEERRQQEAEEKRQREEDARRKREEQERAWREELETRVRRQEEEKRMKKQVSFSQRSERVIDIEVEGRPPSRERIIDIELEDRPESRERIIDIEMEEERPASRERIIDIEIEKDPEPQFQRYDEMKREVIQEMRECCGKKSVEEERRRSLREQVQVHQSIREQQAPEKRQPTLQERRLCSRMQKQSQGETCKKHVQFIEQTESGPAPLPPTPIKNTGPKEWKSGMCQALTTAPERPYSPFTSETQEQRRQLYSREIRYEESYGPPPEPNLPELPPRPYSPFRDALTTAPDRPYTPLGEDPCTSNRSRTQSPAFQNTPDGYCPPAQILYTDYKPVCTLNKKHEAPRPLPTPPPDYRLRSTSVSPCRSRAGTPCCRSQKPAAQMGLKKPGAIPSYQQNLICVKSVPVDGQEHDPSRTPTPTPKRTKSPAHGPPEPCHIRAQAPRIKESTPVRSTENYHYHCEEDTSQAHKSQIYTKRADYQTESGQTKIHERRSRESSVEERFEENGTIRRTKKTQYLDEHTDRVVRKSAFQPPAPPEPEEPECAISRESSVGPSLPCPVVKPSGSEKFPRTGVRVLPPIPTQEVRRIAHEVPVEKKKTCPETGVTVIPCRAHSDSGSKTGVVIVPCDRPSENCNPSGVCVTPTFDRSGVCVSPCPTQSGGVCEKPSCYCGATSGACGPASGDCSMDAGTCTGTGVCVKTCGDGYMVTPCSVSGVRSVQCPKPKPILKPQPNHPFPQIPVPESSSNGCRGFQPIHKPRTNLANQLTRLTVKPTNKPTVQLYKPQPQNQCSSRTQFLSKTEISSYQGQCPSSVDPAPNLSSLPDLGLGSGAKSGSFAGSSAPKRGRGVLNQASAGSRVPLCAHCHSQVR